MTSTTDARRELAGALRRAPLLGPLTQEAADDALGKAGDPLVFVKLLEALEPRGVHLLEGSPGNRSERAWVCALASTWAAVSVARHARYEGLLADTWRLDQDPASARLGILPVSGVGRTSTPGAWHEDSTPYLYEYDGEEHAWGVERDANGWTAWLESRGLPARVPADSCLLFVTSLDPRGLNELRQALTGWVKPSEVEEPTDPDYTAVDREEDGPWEPMTSRWVAHPGLSFHATLGVLATTTDDALSLDLLYALPVAEHARAAYFVRAPAAVTELAKSPLGRARATIAASKHLTVEATRWFTWAVDTHLADLLRDNPARIPDPSGYDMVEPPDVPQPEELDPDDELDDHTWLFRPPNDLTAAGRDSWLVNAADDADRSVLVRRTTDLVLLRAAALHPLPEVRMLAAANPGLPPELGAAVAADPDSDVRCVAAGNPAVPVDLLAELEREARELAGPDEELDDDFAAAFAGNTAAPARLLLELADAGYDVLDALVGRQDPEFSQYDWSELLGAYEGDLEELHARGIPALQAEIVHFLMNSDDSGHADLALELCDDADFEQVAERLLDVYAQDGQDMQRLYASLASDSRMTDTFADTLINYDANSQARRILACNTALSEQTRTGIILTGRTYADLQADGRSIWATRTRRLGTALLEAFSGDPHGLRNAVRALDQRPDVLLWTPNQIVASLS